MRAAKLAAAALLDFVLNPVPAPAEEAEAEAEEGAADTRPSPGSLSRPGRSASPVAAAEAGAAGEEEAGAAAYRNYTSVSPGSSWI